MSSPIHHKKSRGRFGCRFFQQTAHAVGRNPPAFVAALSRRTGKGALGYNGVNSVTHTPNASRSSVPLMP